MLQPLPRHPGGSVVRLKESMRIVGPRAGDQIISTDYVLHCKASSYGSIATGDTVTVAGTAYTCRTNERDLDGLTCQISLSKN